MRQLAADITRLRRGDLYAERIDLERQWLALDASNAESQKEKDFWDWTKRPDINKKLFPDKKPGISPEALKEMQDKLNLM